MNESSSTEKQYLQVPRRAESITAQAGLVLGFI